MVGQILSRRGLILVCLTFVAILLIFSTRSKRIVREASQASFSAPPPLPEFDYTEKDRESLQYVPPDVVRAWRERNFLVMLGVLSPDNAVRRRRRHLQRLTCWQYQGVARRSNNFTGDLLVTFVLARHPDHNYTHSPQLVEEGLRWQDIIALPIKEGRVSTNKVIGQDGRYWGPDAEIGMSRKMYKWFSLMLRLLPNVNYVAKSDDDMFVHTPQYLADLRALPRRRLYWGNIVNARFMPLLFATGGLYTASREVVEQFLAYEPLKKLVDVPYSKEREDEFTSLYMQHEDLLMGRVLYEMGYQPLFVGEPMCRFHNLHGKGWVGPLSHSSLMIHNVKEEEYAQLREYFGEKKQYRPSRFKVRRGRLYATCGKR